MSIRRPFGVVRKRKPALKRREFRIIEEIQLVSAVKLISGKRASGLSSGQSPGCRRIYIETDVRNLTAPHPFSFPSRHLPSQTGNLTADRVFRAIVGDDNPRAARCDYRCHGFPTFRLSVLRFDRDPRERELCFRAAIPASPTGGIIPTTFNTLIAVSLASGYISAVSRRPHDVFLHPIRRDFGNNCWVNGKFPQI